MNNIIKQETFILGLAEDIISYFKDNIMIPYLNLGIENYDLDMVEAITTTYAKLIDFEPEQLVYVGWDNSGNYTIKTYSEDMGDY